MAETTYLAAVHDALREELERAPEVVCSTRTSRRAVSFA